MTDEPLGSHVLELEVVDVIDETSDARSLVFAATDGANDSGIPTEKLRYAPGQFLTLRVPSDRTGSV
ncbi:MAG: 3-ketosteroid-9-alpha-hydroxylase, partial [Actinomycetia bacterium]|nr:3-ketosteroid-9-alpha-hydroxylase [Actinomycetes bacterium]